MLLSDALDMNSQMLIYPVSVCSTSAQFKNCITDFSYPSSWCCQKVGKCWELQTRVEALVGG